MYKIFIPKSEKLKKYIYNFCILNEFEGRINYLAFAQLGTSLAFYFNSCLTFEDDFINITNKNKYSPQILLLGKYKSPIQIQYNSYSPEISINFTPIGLNYFFDINTSEIAKNSIQLIDNEKWSKIGSEIFDQNSNEKKIDFLELFLLKNLVEKDLSNLETCISHLNQNPTFPISTIANKLNVSTKTINRWFANYVGCSPTDFKKIVRFRKAIDTKFNDSFKNLTQICFESNFYDSPHFTREFRKLNQMSPRDFFSDIRYVANKNIPYKFL